VALLEDLRHARRRLPDEVAGDHERRHVLGLWLFLLFGLHRAAAARAADYPADNATNHTACDTAFGAANHAVRLVRIVVRILRLRRRRLDGLYTEIRNPDQFTLDLQLRYNIAPVLQMKNQRVDLVLLVVNTLNDPEAEGLSDR